MEKDPNRIVRDWTEEDERKYREMLSTPIGRPTEQELYELACASPNPPLGARIEREHDKETEKHNFNEKSGLVDRSEEMKEKLQGIPKFEPFDSDLFTEKIAETANKTAQVSHDLEMKRIKAKLIADLCLELVKMPMRYEDVVYRAREIAENALKDI